MFIPRYPLIVKEWIGKSSPPPKKYWATFQFWVKCHSVTVEDQHLVVLVGIKGSQKAIRQPAQDAAAVVGFCSEKVLSIFFFTLDIIWWIDR